MAINDYEGAVILISHDRHIIETCADRLWLVADGTVKPFDGDMDDYTALVLDRTRAGRRVERAHQASSRARAKGNPAVVQKKLQELDGKILEIKNKIISTRPRPGGSRDLCAGAEEGRQFRRLRARLAAELDAHETQWLEAHDG